MGVARGGDAEGAPRQVRAPLRDAVLGVVCAGALVWGASSRLSGQEVQFRQRAGLYLPTRLSIQNGVLDLQQKIGLTVGARLTLAFNPRFSLATGLTYIPGYAVLRAAGQQFSIATGSHLLTASMGAIYWLLPRGKRVSWEIHSGLAMASGGKNYEQLLQGSTLSGVLGTMLRWEIGRLVSLRIRIQERLYRFRWGSGGSPGAGKPLRISFGVGFPLLQTALQRSRMVPSASQ